MSVLSVSLITERVGSKTNCIKPKSRITSNSNLTAVLKCFMLISVAVTFVLSMLVCCWQLQTEMFVNAGLHKLKSLRSSLCVSDHSFFCPCISWLGQIVLCLLISLSVSQSAALTISLDIMLSKAYIFGMYISCSMHFHVTLLCWPDLDPLTQHDPQHGVPQPHLVSLYKEQLHTAKPVLSSHLKARVNMTFKGRELFNTSQFIIMNEWMYYEHYGLQNVDI